MRSLNVKKVLRQHWLGVLTSACLICQLGCKVSTVASHASSEALAQTLVMGVSADYPPFEFSKDGQLVGFDIDLAHEIAREAGFLLKIQDMDFGALIPSLQGGRIDFAMSGMTINEERSKNVAFSESYFSSSFSIVVEKESPIAGEKDFPGKKIGVQLGSTMEKFAKEKAILYPGMEVVSLGKNQLLIQGVKTKRLDGMIVEDIQAASFVRSNPMLKVVSLSTSSDGYAIAFSKKNSRSDLMVKQFNNILRKLHENSTLELLRKKWLVQ